MKKIMLVDDNALSVEGIQKNIDYAALGAQVVHVKYDGSAAMEAMKQEPVDIIISDIEMPDLDGISMSRPAMIEKFFNDLVHYPGKEASWHLTSYLEYLSLDLDYRFFAVVVFDVENAADLKNGLGVAQYEMQLYHLQDTIKEYSRIFDFSYLLKGFDGLELILCQNSSSASHVLQSVHKTVSSVVEKYRDSGLSLNVGIGNIVSELWNMHLSHESAHHALEYRFFFPQKNIFDTREALGRNLSLEPFSDSREDELIRLICQKDYAAMERWIQDFSADLISKYQSRDFIFVRIYSLLGRILKFLYELNLDAGDLEEKIAQTYARLDSFLTSEQFFSWLYEICTLACQKLDASLRTYHDQLCGSVLSFIRENFENSGLCLHDIAKSVNVSPAYLSALFKKNQKISISDTIAAARIEAACHYLENSSLSLKEISEKCGYANQYYFSTSFKKNKGISPSAYREGKMPVL